MPCGNISTRSSMMAPSSARQTDYWRALLGGIILLLVLLFPQGLAGFARQLQDAWRRREGSA